MRDRYRVAVYVFDGRPGTTRVLCFDHADFPEAGTQIPAGGVSAAETLEAAAAREVLEETGIQIVDLRALAVQVIEDHDREVRKVTVFITARARDFPADRWRHVVPPHEGEDSGMIFDCFFLEVDDAATALQIDRQAEFLGLVPADWPSGL